MILHGREKFYEFLSELKSIGQDFDHMGMQVMTVDLEHESTELSHSTTVTIKIKSRHEDILLTPPLEFHKSTSVSPGMELETPIEEWFSTMYINFLIFLINNAVYKL